MKTLFRLYRRFLLWTETRVVKCNTCGATSDRQFKSGAERIARNHARGTGHANITVKR
jgi:hypothetical protein